MHGRPRVSDKSTVHHNICSRQTFDLFHRYRVRTDFHNTYVPEPAESIRPFRAIIQWIFVYMYVIYSYIAADNNLIVKTKRFRMNSDVHIVSSTVIPGMRAWKCLGCGHVYLNYIWFLKSWSTCIRHSHSRRHDLYNDNDGNDARPWVWSNLTAAKRVSDSFRCFENKKKKTNHYIRWQLRFFRVRVIV